MLSAKHDILLSSEDSKPASAKYDHDDMNVYQRYEKTSMSTSAEHDNCYLLKIAMPPSSVESYTVFECLFSLISLPQSRLHASHSHFSIATKS